MQTVVDEFGKEIDDFDLDTARTDLVSESENTKYGKRFEKTRYETGAIGHEVEPFQLIQQQTDDRARADLLVRMLRDLRDTA